MSAVAEPRVAPDAGRDDAASGVRLQKMLSAAGIASRRAAERLMQEGRVTVNGRAVTALGARADPACDAVRVDGRLVGRAPQRRYILVNKPRGVVTTRKDPQRRRTVLDLLPRVREYVYPVGRLDYDSEGLVLVTNDGGLAARLTHPRHGLERVYEALVEGVPSATSLRRLRDGVPLDGRRTVPAAVRLLGGHRTRSVDQARLEITLREGRNRQVRRMLAAVGHRVRRLRRIQFGPLRDRRLPAGRHRELSRGELAALRGAVSAVGERAPDAADR